MVAVQAGDGESVTFADDATGTMLTVGGEVTACQLNTVHDLMSSNLGVPKTNVKGKQGRRFMRAASLEGNTAPEVMELL